MKANKFLLVFTAFVMVAGLWVFDLASPAPAGAYTIKCGKCCICPSCCSSGPDWPERHHRERPREIADPAIEALRTGNRLSNQGRYSEAEAYFRRAMALNPRYASPHWNLASDLIEQGRYMYKNNDYRGAEAAFREGVAEMREALRLDPRNKKYKQGVAEWEEYLQKREEQAELNASIDAASDAFERGLSLLEKEDYGGAEVAFREVIRKFPDNAASHHNLGVALALQKHFDEAEAAYRESLRLRPGSSQTIKNLAWVRRERDTTANIQRMLDKMQVEARPSSPSSGSLEFIEPSEPVFSKGTKFSAPVDVREFTATTGEGFQYGQDLRDYTQKADWPMRAKSAFTLGIAKASRGQYNKAINYLQEAITTGPNEPLLKNALSHVKDLKAAKKVKASAGPLARETVNPDNLAHFPIKVQAEVNLAGASIVVGDYDVAVKYMNEALETLPNDQGLRDGLLYVKQLKAARDERAAGPVDPDRYRAARVRAKGEAAWNLGLYLSEKSDYEATVRYLKEARSLVQNDLSTRLIDKLIANVRTLPAKPIEGIPIYPSKADAILDALEYGKGDWGASLRYLEVAHNSDPSYLPVRDALNYLQGLHGYHQFSTSR